MGTYPLKIEGQDMWVIWQSTTEVFFEPTFRSEAFACRVAKYWCELSLLEMTNQVNLQEPIVKVGEQLRKEIGFDPDTDCPIDDEDKSCTSCDDLYLDGNDNFRCSKYKYKEEE